MTDDAVIEVLNGQARPAPVGVTWLPEDALTALFWGRSSGVAEALGALVENVPLEFAFVPAEAPWAEDAVRAIAACGALPMWSVIGPLGRVEASLGAVEALGMSAAEPARLAAIIDRQLHAALDEVRRAAALGVRAVVIADDVAGAQGPLVSPDYALEALVPCYRRLAEQVLADGLVPVFHSDGDIRTLVPALAKSGYRALHAGGLSGSRFDSFAVTAWANGCVAAGGLGAGRLLEATREQADCVVSLARRGRLLVSDDGGIASAEQLAAFVTAARTVRLLRAQSSA